MEGEADRGLHQSHRPAEPKDHYIPPLSVPNPQLNEPSISDSNTGKSFRHSVLALCDPVEKHIDAFQVHYDSLVRHSVCNRMDRLVNRVLGSQSCLSSTV